VKADTPAPTPSDPARIAHQVVEIVEKLVIELEEEMFQAAEELRFERAAELRDAIKELRRELDERRGLAREPRTAPTPARRGRRSGGRRR